MLIKEGKGNGMALSEATKKKRMDENIEKYIQECLILAIEFLKKYNEPVTDKRLLQIQN